MTANTSKTGILGQLLQQSITQIIINILMLGILIVGIYVLIWPQVQKIGSMFTINTVTTAEVRNVILGGLRDMNELTTADMSTKSTVHVSQEQRLGSIYLGDTNVTFEGVGTVQAGINMQELEIKEINLKKHTIHLVLPAPRISQAFLDVEASQVVDEYRRWLGPDAEAKLQDQAQKEALKKIKAEACSGHILDAASNHAQYLIKQILTTAGYQEVQVDVKPVPAGTCPTA